MSEWFIYPLVGVLAGMASGFLGLGGGIIVVPSLLSIFILQGVPESIAMHMAVATSLMTIIVTSLTSSYSHYRLQTVNWHWVLRLSPGLILGGLVGAYLTTRVSGALLQIAFALYACLAAYRIWFSLSFNIIESWQCQPVNIMIGWLIGIISSLVGIGGGTLIVPYLMAVKQPMSRAIGTSAVCCLPIALSAVLGYYILDADVHNTDVNTADLIQWHAFAGIIMTSIIFSVLSASWSKKVPTQQLRRIFSVVLVITAIVLISKI